jgi:hypothetical protein
MQVTEVIVSAGRTFNHPFESYSNLKPHITLKATLDGGDDVESCVKELQRKAERMVEDHKVNLLRAINDIEMMQTAAKEIDGLELSMRRAQERLAELRGKFPSEPAANLLTGGNGEPQAAESRPLPATEQSTPVAQMSIEEIF